MNILIFGFSNHTKNRIIPALLKFGNFKITIVTNNIPPKQSEELSGIKILDYNQLNSNQKIYDAIILATLPSQHLKLLLEYLNYSNLFLIEKPILIDSAKIKEIIDLKSSGKLIFETLMYKYHPCYEFLSNIKNLEKIESVEAVFTIPHLEQENFRYDKKRGGGVIYDQGIYPLSLAIEISKTEPKILSHKEIFDKKLNMQSGKYIELLLDKNIHFKGLWQIGADYKNQVIVNSEKAQYIFDRFFSKPAEFNSKIQINKVNQKTFHRVGNYDQFFLMYKKIFFESNLIFNTEFENLKRRYNLIKKIENINF